MGLYPRRRPAATPRTRRLRRLTTADRDRNRLCLAALLIAGVALRIWLWSSPLAAVDGDEAVVGLMARRMLDGEFQAFFWGQEYGGVHEAALVAILLAVRVPDAIAMELVPVALHAAAAAVVWRIGLRTIGSRAAALAAGLFWAMPAAFLWQSTKERGYYGAVLVAGLSAVLFALRLRD